MIVKDEEANLPECLASAADLVDEVVVVDTGSADRTKEVAARFHARVFDFPWMDDFAAARNEGLKHATGDWAFWLDADDRLDGDNRARLKALIDGLRDENAAYVMKCLCLPDPETRTATVVDHVRLFRNDPALRREYRVHEQILPSLRRGGGDVGWSDVVVRHVGYQDPALRRRKLERDGRILRLEHADKPDDPFILFNLGSIAHELGRCEEAVTFLGRSLALSNPKDSIVRKLYALLAQGHRRLGQDGLALAACRKGREFYPDDVELLFQEGVVLRARGDRAGARRCWTELLRPRPADHFASLDTGLSGYKTRHNLAQLELEEGNLSGAEAHWRAALAEQAAFMPAQLGLGEVYCAGALGRSGACGGRVGGRRPGGRGRRAAGARPSGSQGVPVGARLLEAAITKAPQAVALRRVLSYALLQEGKDWSAAERALCELLKLDPGTRRRGTTWRCCCVNKGAVCRHSRVLCERYGGLAKPEHGRCNPGAAEVPCADEASRTYCDICGLLSGQSRGTILPPSRPPPPPIAPTFSSGSQGAVMDAAAWGTEKLKGGGQPSHAERKGLLRLQAFLRADNVRRLEGQSSASWRDRLGFAGLIFLYQTSSSPSKR